MGIKKIREVWVCSAEPLRPRVMKDLKSNLYFKLFWSKTLILNILEKPNDPREGGKNK